MKSQKYNSEKSPSNCPSSLVIQCAKRVGLKMLDKDIVEYLSNDIEEKLFGVIQKAKQFMRVSKRKKLSMDDLRHSMKSFNEKDVTDSNWVNIDKEKDETIDIEDYLRTPMPQHPIKPFGHFHWLIIEGNRPNIPENFINSNPIIYPKMDIDPDISQLILMNDLNHKHNTASSSSMSSTSVPLNQKEQSANHKVIPKLKHNISKELAVFREDFECTFNQEIKKNLLHIDATISLMRETEMNLVVLQSEAGIVNLLPLLLDLLINTMVNDHFKNEAKVHMIVLLHIKAIIHNKFFFLIPYLSQTISLLLSIILSEGNDAVFVSIQSKNTAIEMLKYLLDKYSPSYPLILHNVVEIFKEHIVPDAKKPKFLTSFGAIKAITTLSSKHIKEIIYPRIEDILNSFKFDIKLRQKASIDKNEVEVEQKKEETSHSVSLPPSLPKYSFSLSLTALADPFITSSIFAVGPSLSQAIHPGINPPSVHSAHNVSKSFEKEMQIDNMTNNSKTSISYNAIHTTWDTINLKSSYVFYALVDSVKLLFSSNYEDKDIVHYLNETFGEALLTSRKDNPELHLFL